jgi:peptidoglycan hydrolase CwlO-like protein
MEEQVIQTPVAPEPQPVAGADTAQPTLDVSGIKAEYESQINALKVQAAEADERFQGIKAKLDEVYKKQDDQRKKVLQDQGQWKDL